ncbi:MAG TPA: hypothetical protein DDX85_05275 [Nitrospiraceae bacterium]|nr:hypothetical protein [Nitrospiraceae bacterium]
MLSIHSSHPPPEYIIWLHYILTPVQSAFEAELHRLAGKALPDIPYSKLIMLLMIVKNMKDYGTSQKKTGPKRAGRSVSIYLGIQYKSPSIPSFGLHYTTYMC